ncbi:DUF3347 domain-containing protein [Mesonia sp.]|uniref:DUF3347 domain-containing protein n=1 Tax=Mesonia sp. TaxID=1960830 RepID=UPI003F98ACBA
MKTVKRSIGTLALAATMILSVSCKDANKSETAAPVSKGTHQEMTNDHKDLAMNDSQDSKSEIILKDYFNLKDALVNDDNAKAKKLGSTLTKSLKSFEVTGYPESKQAKLKEVIDNAAKHAAPIEKNDIKQQREHFKKLSAEITNMVAITGTETKLYEQFCPMYDGGTAWLSTKEEIRNPYYGSQMLKCGKVQREIN